MASKEARVLLVGSGGIGTIAALNLECGGQAKVTAVLRSNYDAVSRNGFIIKSCEHGDLEGWRPAQGQRNPAAVLKAVPNTSSLELGRQFEYIVCCTKNIPDAAPSLCDTIAPAVSPATVIVLIQNGLNIQLPFFQRFPSNIVLSGVSRIDAHEHSPGVVEQKQHDLLYVGAFKSSHMGDEEQQQAARHFVAMYGAGGKTTCLYRPEVEFDRWEKLVYNASFNPICALTGLNTGELQRTGRMMDTMVIPAMREVLEAARGAGHELPKDIIDSTIRLNPIEGDIAPSMQVDFQKGNLIEHENILGEVVREAQKHSVATPVLSVLYELCCGHQWRFKQDKGHV
ncbi:hypothetical protein CCHL11_03669 [Colletotrichum chlorophyti]|uniref:2-dehydropantoate 2-reductase n=1 Tax=Colletotrichum chlorophyti TaxID=708187 RepID=A0A1Q8RSA7_9PEZI|nr:hypothetical protein CCHL11_03669 [Colletotrichum chlorophyti]